MKLSTVGRRVPRIDAREKVTGQALYTGDIKLHGMLHTKVKRSPHPYAKILKIDTSKAERLPGVKGVVTGKDIPGVRHGLGVLDRFFIARDTVRFIGEAVAAVAADDIDIAEEALELIDIKYERLPAIFDPEEAMRQNPPVIIHPDLTKYEIEPVLPPRLVPDRPNVCNHFRVRFGYVEKGFRESDYIFENRFSTAMVHHGQMENHTHIARFEPDGSLTVWTSTQSLPVIQSYLSTALKMPRTKIRVIVPYVGGGFGVKSTPKEEAICALLAQKTKRPVILEYTREESISAVGGRVPFVVYLKDGVNKNGKLLARQVKTIINLGAYADNGYLIVRNTAFGASGQYKIPNFKLDSYGVYTNIVPATAYRGFGSPEVLWAIESQMDMIAEKLRIDPVELRMMNLLEEGDVNVMGQRMHSVGAKECLSKAAEAIEWEKQAEIGGVWRYGKGIALGNKFSLTFTASEAAVKVHGDETIEVRTMATEIGQGAHTVLAQIAAEEFGVSIDKVKISHGDTSYIPFAHGAFSSRQTFNDGNAVRLACLDAKRQLFEQAAKKLEAVPQELETKEGRIYVKDEPSKAIRIRELFTAALWWPPGFIEKSGEILGKATWYSRGYPMDPETGQSERSANFWIYNSQAAEVEVNMETGEVRVLKHVSVGDCGKVVNPLGAESQIRGGMHMAQGNVLCEEMIFDNGKVLNPRFVDCKMPTALDLPRLDNNIAILVEVPHNEGPYGAKGLGEGTLTAGAPAIANAIHNAIGIRFKDLPITPSKILRAIKEDKH